MLQFGGPRPLRRHDVSIHGLDVIHLEHDLDPEAGSLARGSSDRVALVEVRQAIEGHAGGAARQRRIAARPFTLAFEAEDPPVEVEGRGEIANEELESQLLRHQNFHHGFAGGSARVSPVDICTMTPA